MMERPYEEMQNTIVELNKALAAQREHLTRTKGTKIKEFKSLRGETIPDAGS
jgi:hypothetical protein